MEKKWKASELIWRIVSLILIGGVICFFAFVASLMMLLTGADLIFQYLVAGAGVIVLILCGLHMFRLFSDRNRKRVSVLLPVAALVIWGGCFGYHTYIESIPTVGSQQVDLEIYEPFRADTKAVTLKEPATLKLEGDLPRLDGATALYPIYAAFGQAVYPEGEYPLYGDSAIAYNNTVGAYERLITGEADIIFVAGPSEEQKQMAAQNGKELYLTPIGKEAFVFFVNGKNPVEDLTIEQVQGIYSGDIVNWSELGGKNQEIRPFQRPENSGSQTALENLMKGKTLMEPEKEDVVDAMSGIVEKTSDYKNFKNAIGYSFRYYASEMVQDQQIKFLKLGGVYPDRDTIRNGSYPIASEFYAVTTTKDDEKINALLDWIRGPQGQYLVEQSGYVGL